MMVKKNNSRFSHSQEIGDVQFSGPTYQVQVLVPKEGQAVWVFLHLDKEGNIVDAFCSCEQGEQCSHIPIAYQFLYSGEEEPLHRRYLRSLWYYLCNIFAERSNFGTSHFIASGKGKYEWRTPSGKLLFIVYGITKEGREFLKEIVEHREEQTEETSLKFSNLSPEELKAWKEGKPSSRLQFELSFWNDLGQYLVLQQVKGFPYKITFQYSSRSLPSWLQCEFKEIGFGCAISEAELSGLIPYLATVELPLKVYGFEEVAISSITYDQVQGTLHIHADKKKEIAIEAKQSLGGIDLGNWIFIPDDGFYAKSPLTFFGDTVLKSEEIVWALNEQRHILREFLTKAKIHEDTIKLNYTITFDGDWNLHIVGYLFEPGDLSRPYSRFWVKWAYLQNDGFYRLEDVQFPRVETIVLSNDVSDFVIKNRIWFNTQQGFHTHLTGIESRLHYEVNERGALCIGTTIASEEEQHDFGHWVYLKDQGFYQKVHGITVHALPIGSSIEPESIPYLIRTLHDELSLIPNFFSKVNPVDLLEVCLHVNQAGQIIVDVGYKRTPSFENVPLRIYEEFVFAEGFGFHTLPLPAGFPRKFTKTTPIDPRESTQFFLHELPILKKFAKQIDSNLEEPKSITLSLEHFEKEKEIGKYSVKLMYRTELGSISADEIWKAMKRGDPYLFLKAGALDLKREQFQWVSLVEKKHLDLRRKTFHFETVEFLRINAFDPIQISEKASEETRSLFFELMEFKTPVEADLSALKSTLWHYQENGFKWLWFLYHHHLSGLLCDDMGLGKTHQAMALMAAVRAWLQRPCHFLVLCPTSVIYHWQDKLHTFLPQARVLTFYGTERSMEGFSHEYDLLLTSYGIWRRDSKILKKIPFEVAIFDEIQLAKNPKSKLHASLSDIQATIRLGMTGTPIENELAELKALFDLVLPHYMPGEAQFKEVFQKPIEKEGNIERRALLSRYVRPFILRRKKEDVLTELPEKIEEISYCPLLSEQRKLYQKILEESRKPIFDQLENREKSMPYFHVFALLSRLKQICDHPAVFYKDPEKYQKYYSGKWELFLELLHESRDSGKKVVVFSQYLAQLDIIEAYLREHRIGYAAIRGQTVRRKEEMDRFREDPKCEVFVASLQAAGLGIELTAASVVIHYDRWWNAARENQATDRVHRIGQSRGVQVFKMVTRGTFEEKIHAMIERKGKLMEDIIGVDDQQIVKSLTRDEIIELLQDVHLGVEDQQEPISDEE